jgi:nitroreductase
MVFSKPVEQIIRQRYSSRTFDQKPLKSNKLAQLEEALTPRKGPFGNSIRFEFIDSKNILTGQKVRIGTYGLVKGARYFIVGIMEKNCLNLVDFGYTFEEMILQMTDLNLGTVWMGASFNSNVITNLIEIKDNETIPAITPVGYIASNKSPRERMISSFLKSRNRKLWQSLFFENDFNTPLTKENAKKYILSLEMVRLAPSAKNLQPWRIIKLNNNFHFYALITKSHAYFPPMDLGIAMCHFELTAKEQKLLGKWIFEKPKFDSLPNNYHYITSWTFD